MHLGLFSMAIACLGCLVIQLLPILSVPVTGKSTNYNLYLSKYQNFKYGVFGICNLNATTCSAPSIGYPPKGDSFYKLLSGVDDAFEEDFGVIELPSKARYTVSKLLVVHVVAFCFSGCLFIMIVYLSILYSSVDTVKMRLVEQFKKIPRRKKLSREESLENINRALLDRQLNDSSHPNLENVGILGELQSDSIPRNSNSNNNEEQITHFSFDENSDTSNSQPSEDDIGLQETSSTYQTQSNNTKQISETTDATRVFRTESTSTKPRFLPSVRKKQKDKNQSAIKIDVTPHLNFILMFCLSSFLSSLLAFLSDVMLFVPHLSYLGWLQFFPIISTAVMASMTCFMKRSVTSRKIFNDTTIHLNDDMRMRRNINYSNWEDSESDDGFFVYTNGFYSTYNNNKEMHHVPPQNNSSSRGWKRSAPSNGARSENIELSNIQLSISESH